MKPFNEKIRGEAKFLKDDDFVLHGDVIVARDYPPDDFESMPEVKDHCLAYGEATGHAHKIFGDDGAFQLRECPKTKVRHLKVVRDVCLKHQEHEGITIPPGFYRIGIQNEWDPMEKMKRQVID